jgi:hypothetical protein
MSLNDIKKRTKKVVAAYSKSYNKITIKQHLFESAEGKYSTHVFSKSNISVYVVGGMHGDKSFSPVIWSVS